MPGRTPGLDVLIFVSSDPRYDTRSTKYLASLKTAGYKARLVGVCSDGKIEKNEELVRLPVTSKGGKGFFFQFYEKAVLEALKSDARIVIAGDLFSLMPAVINKQRHNRKSRPVRLIYDSKELYDALPSLQGKRSSFLFWNLVEKSSIRYVDSVFTVNESIADILETKWHLPTNVLMNVPIRQDVPSLSPKSFDRIFLTFSGGMQPGRGLPGLIRLISILPHKYQLRFVGDGAMREQLADHASVLGVQDRVHFVGRVRNDEVVAELSKGHIGMYLMENTGLCHYLSLPNKLFQFIAARLPVIVPKFPEMERIVTKYEIGASVDTSDIQEVAKTVEGFTSTVERYISLVSNCEKAAEVLNWQVEEKKFLSVISDLL